MVRGGLEGEFYMTEKIRVLTYNIHHGEGIDGTVSIKRIADVIRRTEPDLVALQEVDCYMPRSLFLNQARNLARELNIHYSFGTNSRWFHFMKYGNAVLSRFPIIQSTNYPLTYKQEKRGLLGVQINYGAGEIFCFSTHLGLSGRERDLQVKEILSIITGINKPLILAGDFNAGSESGEIAAMGSRLWDCTRTASDALKTFPSYNPQFKLDYIFVSPHWQVISIAAIPDLASDHLPLAANLFLRHY